MVMVLPDMVSLCNSTADSLRLAELTRIRRYDSLKSYGREPFTIIRACVIGPYEIEKSVKIRRHRVLA